MPRVLFLTWALGASIMATTPAAEPGSESVPAGFAPFAHLTGGWKGTAIPAANRLKGWRESHSWAWKFVQGQPVGLTLNVQGGQVLAQGTLTYDPASKHYRLEGTDPQGQPVTFSGDLEEQGKLLTLNRQETTPAGPERLTIRVLPENPIRYVMWLERKGPGQPLFTHVIDVGLTKEGESIAASGSTSNEPKCVITGGAATLSVTYQGKTYPVCCTGCRDEFLADPDKYVQLVARRAAATSTPAAAPPSRPRENDGAFSDLVDEDEPAARPGPRPQRSSVEPPRPGVAPGPPEETKPTTSPEPPPKPDPARAGTLLRLGQALERSGHSTGALRYYQQIVTDYPNTPEAQAASARIEALSR